MWRLDIPTPWGQALPADVASLSRAVAAGDFPLVPAIRLMRSFEQGPLYLALVLRGFEGRIRPRFVDEARRTDVSRRLARFFTTWKRLGQPPDVLASAALRLTIEKEELTRTPSGFATPEVFHYLRQNWDEERAESVLAFFDKLGAENGSTTTSPPDTGVEIVVEEPRMPEPLDELRSEIARLVALGSGSAPRFDLR